MSHLGFKILYKILNDHPRTLAERCYTPWIDMQDELRARQVPLVSLESARPLSDFDVVGFSLQFELTYTNVLTMLDLGGVPLRAGDRGESDPLVMAGGPTATHPEPLAAFLDAVVVGDGEERATRDRASLDQAAQRRRAARRAAGGALAHPRGVRSLAVRTYGGAAQRAAGASRPRPTGRRSRWCARSSPTSTTFPSPTTDRWAGPKPSSIACRSRLPAAAPRGAASARRG